MTVRPVRAFSSGSGTPSSVPKSTIATLDCQEEVRVAATTESITYSTDWMENVPEGAIAVVMVDDLVLTNDMGSGTVKWTPKHNGKYVLTHKIIKDGIQIGNTISSIFEVSGIVEISEVSVRQRYPWNGLVDINYTVQGDATLYELQVEVEDMQGEMKYYPTKYLSAKDVSEGRHTITWNVEAENITIVSTNVVVKLSLIQSDFHGVTNDLYYIVDLSGGSDAAKYPVVMRSSIPNGVWTDEYKSNKLVLKKIRPGDIPTREARITRPYYIGVFEVTRKQYELVTGAYPTPSNQYCNEHGDYSPVNGVSYNMIRGSAVGTNWPESAEVDADSFLGVLRCKTSQAFDLPTEAQWEYACRAGTSSKYNNGGSAVEDLVVLARCGDNWNDGKGGYSMWYTTVGAYAPNAWGLYDMHGNAREWCRDRYSYDYVVKVAGTPFYYDYTDYAGVVMTGDDPGGAPAGYGNDGKPGERRVCKGGSFGSASVDCASGQTGYQYTTIGDYSTGFRLVCAVSEFSLPVEDYVPVVETFTRCQLNTDSAVSVDPIPDIGENPTPEQIGEVLQGAGDSRIASNITNAEDYAAYRTWALALTNETVSAQTVKQSDKAWLSFALGTDALIVKELVSDDLKIESFSPASVEGKFEFTVGVENVNVGAGSIADEMLKANLNKVFGLEGGTSLQGLSSDNVDITFGAPMNGKVKFTAGPDAKNADAKTFFMRVKMTP